MSLSTGPHVIAESPYLDRPAGGLAWAINRLRGESISGVLLIIGAAIAVLWMNTPGAHLYQTLQETTFGPESINLHIPLSQWASDGLLAIFFFVVGVELKRELAIGSLSSVRTAIIPMAAAVGGMIVPAAIYLLFNTGATSRGWAIPSATDIAFAVAILSIVGRRLPTSMRAFLLTLAVVDDLLAIVIIAINYTEHLALIWFFASAACVVVFALLLRAGITHWWVLIPLGVLSWGLLFQSGIHATIAGVALGMVVPARPLTGAAGRRTPAYVKPEASLVDRFEWKFGPLSAGLAVPLFALLSAGVRFDGETISAAVKDPVALGVAFGLVVGKPIGITATTWLVCRFKTISLAQNVGWADIAGLGVLAGIGFTVSMLITDLAFGKGSEHFEHGIMAVLCASVFAAVVGGLLLVYRGRVHARRGDA